MPEHEQAFTGSCYYKIYCLDTSSLLSSHHPLAQPWETKLQDSWSVRLCSVDKQQMEFDSWWPIFIIVIMSLCQITEKIFTFQRMVGHVYCCTVAWSRGLNEDCNDRWSPFFSVMQMMHRRKCVQDETGALTVYLLLWKLISDRDWHAVPIYFQMQTYVTGLESIISNKKTCFVFVFHVFERAPLPDCWVSGSGSGVGLNPWPRWTPACSKGSSSTCGMSGLSQKGHVTKSWSWICCKNWRSKKENTAWMHPTDLWD